MKHTVARTAVLALALPFLFAVTPAAMADTLRVISYNALNFGNDDHDRSDDFLTVMREVEPDIAVMQEILSDDAVDELLSFVYLPLNDDWAAATFHNGPDTDNAFFYRTSKVRLISQRAIPTALRDINEYVICPAAMDSSSRVRFYSGHLKASEGSEEENRRLAEVQVLRQQLNLLPAGTDFMFMGDFNLYTADEPAYEFMLSAGTDSDGQLFDPIDEPGDWNNNASFANIHTQSPRVTQFGGGATGGMDDRFDFILVSAGLMDTAGCYVIPSSYHAVGNDGQHFNQAINSGTNQAVPQAVANALHAATDHLPVVADFVFRDPVTPAAELPPVVKAHGLLKCYPNPFNSRLTIQIAPVAGPVSLRIYDLLGREVHAAQVADGMSLSAPLSLDFDGFGSGTYFVRLETLTRAEVQRVMLLR